MFTGGTAQMAQGKVPPRTQNSSGILTKCSNSLLLWRVIIILHIFNNVECWKKLGNWKGWIPASCVCSCSFHAPNAGMLRSDERNLTMTETSFVNKDIRWEGVRHFANVKIFNRWTPEAPETVGRMSWLDKAKLSANSHWFIFDTEFHIQLHHHRTISDVDLHHVHCSGGKLAAPEYIRIDKRLCRINVWQLKGGKVHILKTFLFFLVDQFLITT